MKTLIAIPCMDVVQTMFMKSLLGMHRVGHTEYGIACSSLIYDARNSLARKAVCEDFDRILWLDSDMTFDSDLMDRLSSEMDTGKELVSGLYITRKLPLKPVIFSELGYQRVGDTKELRPFAKTYYDYPKDSVFQIAACGFGGVMTSVKLIKEVADKYGLPFTPLLGFGEDMSFCLRAQELGKKMWCDSTIKLGHVGYSMINETTYLESIKQ